MHGSSAPQARLAPRVAALDGVRGVAILIVVVHNASWIAEPATTLPLKLATTLTAAGWAGVSLFFVLSGFLITGILLDTHESGRYFRSFYVRRALRIFPLYYAFLAIAFWIGPHVVNDPAWAASVRRLQILDWTYLTNWSTDTIRGLGHLWSLAVEEQFYLVWPVIVWLLPRERLLSLCWAMILVTPFVRLDLKAWTVDPLPAYTYTIARWDALAMGAVIALLVREARGRAWLETNAARIAWASLTGIVVLVTMNHGFHYSDLPVSVVGQSLAAILFGALMSLAVLAPRRLGEHVRDALSAAWLRVLGKYSYAIYMFHAPLHQVAKIYLTSVVNRGGAPERLLRLAAYDTGILMVSLLLALVSWNVLEKRFLMLKERLAPA